MSESGSNVTSYCGDCGQPVRANGKFCGNCGVVANAVSPGGWSSSSVGVSGTRSPMLFVGIAMIAVALVAVAGIVLFGDRLGFAGGQASAPTPLMQPSGPEATTDASEPTTLTEDETAGSPGKPATPEPEADEPETPAVPEEETFEQEFITRYYDAVSASDWYTTYSLLDSSSQAEFTEEEWVVAQEARVAATDPSPLYSATVQDVSGEAAGFTADVLLTYTDGTSETVPINAVLEGDGLKRYLTAEDVSYLRSLAGETSTEEPHPGVAEAVEEFVYGYYDAVAAEDWSATYSMLDYGGQAAFSEPEWIERQEARQAASGAPSPVVDVSVSVPEDYAVDPMTTATVTFADGSSVDITVVNPHDRDTDFDRVLTAEEIAFLESL